MLRFLDAGESHGPALVGVVEGLPAGLPVTTGYIDAQLAARQGGYGRGGRMGIERDRVRFLSGVRGGLTMGSPVSLLIINRDWSNWRRVMDSGPGAAVDERVVTRPRPGHADLAGVLKYGHSDIRNILERSSARETAMRVAVGTLARRLLEELGASVYGRVKAIGPVTDSSEPPPQAWPELTAVSRVSCTDPAAGGAMIAAIDQAREAGDTLGGVVEIAVTGVPPGLGSHVHWDRRLDGRLAGALMSIQGIKGVEVGAGFAAAGAPGSAVHDEIVYGSGFTRPTNRAGGIEGGISNGQVLLVRAAMKPIPTLGRPLASVDLATHEPVRAAYERSDVCAVPAAMVVAEAVVAWELGRAVLEKFGGDNLADLKAGLSLYQSRVRQV
ncbi:MAG: chorismate synthase [Peptococcaceae bacterium]|jgi:chorismate synthase|nr:chorismate synthase [Peptococcaceae bacterium]